jgi:hypothetical protein
VFQHIAEGLSTSFVVGPGQMQGTWCVGDALPSPQDRVLAFQPMRFNSLEIGFSFFSG